MRLSPHAHLLYLRALGRAMGDSLEATGFIRAVNVAACLSECSIEDMLDFLEAIKKKPHLTDGMAEYLKKLRKEKIHGISTTVREIKEGEGHTREEAEKDWVGD